jgi:hypothetical protein
VAVIVEGSKRDLPVEQIRESAARLALIAQRYIDREAQR